MHSSSWIKIRYNTSTFLNRGGYKKRYKDSLDDYIIELKDQIKEEKKLELEIAHLKQKIKVHWIVTGVAVISLAYSVYTNSTRPYLEEIARKTEIEESQNSELLPGKTSLPLDTGTLPKVLDNDTPHIEIERTQK